MAAATATVLPGPSAQAAQPPREVEFGVTTSDGLVLPATLRLPANATHPLPAIVLVHGAGPGPREDYRVEAEAFAREGVATLAYDKRTVGYSLVQRDYSRLADDAVAAAALLRGRPEIDPASVGFLGISEGGWVAPLAATRDPAAAFLITVGASGVSPLRQQSWAEAVKAEHAGLRGSVVDAFSRTLYRLISGLGMFPEAYHDPGPALRSLTLPVLGIWGAKDVQCPPVESAAAFRSFLDAAGNRHYTLRDPRRRRARAAHHHRRLRPRCGPGRRLPRAGRFLDRPGRGRQGAGDLRRGRGAADQDECRGAGAGLV